MDGQGRGVRAIAHYFHHATPGLRSLVEGEWRVALYQGDELVRLYSVDWHGDLAAIYEKVIYD